MTTVYEAINLAADRIERNPGAYNHMNPCVAGFGSDPNSGCNIVWIARMAGEITPYVRVQDVANKLGLPMTDENRGEYFDRLTSIAGSDEWKRDAKLCADALRKYAEKYHAPKGSLRALTAVDESFVQLPAFITAQPKRDLIPAGVREIFSRTYTAKDLAV